jgi:SAM-dependent methyltransferase
VGQHCPGEQQQSGEEPALIFFGTREIKVHLERLLRQRATELKGRVSIDVPAGSGRSSRILKELGADVRPLDLFPEFFNVPGLTCEKADLTSVLPVADHSADWILFQEGVEHLPDQLHPLREMNRVLKPGGTLIVTTPNYSNLRARLSYFLNESEYFKYMPPNEIESVWMAHEETDQLYFGHVFNIGIQKLRTLGRFAGFEITRVYPTRISNTAFLLCCIFYPVVFLASVMAYRRALRSSPHVPAAVKRRLFGEQLRLGISPAILCSGHLIVEFAKVMEHHEVKQTLISKMKDFGEPT